MSLPSTIFGTRSRWILAGIELRENVGRGTTQFQRCLSGDWLDVSDTADAVGPKNFLMLSHGLIETLEGWFVNGNFSQFSFRAQSPPSRRFMRGMGGIFHFGPYKDVRLISGCFLLGSPCATR